MTRPAFPPRSRRASRWPRTAPFRLQLLEDRTAPSVTFSGPPGAAIVTFGEDVAGNADSLILRRNGYGQLEYSLNGSAFTKDLKSGVSGVQPLHIAAIARIDVALGAGNDVLTLDFSCGSMIPSASGISYVGGLDNDRINVTRDADFTLTNASLEIECDGTVALSGVEQANLTGGNSRNVIDCSAFTTGPVTLRGGSQTDTLIGGSGDDAIFGDQGNDILYGGAGNDRLDSTNSGQASLFGGPGDDLLIGGNGGDSLYGEAGNDILQGGNGADALFGGPDDDSLEGGSGNDIIDGGAGSDTVVATGDVNFTLSDTTLSGLGTDSLVGIERGILTGGPGSKTLDGSGFSGELSIDGGGGNDTVVGGSGDNTFVKSDTSGGSSTLVGGASTNNFVLSPSGAAILFDGGGVSTISFAGSNAGITISFGLDDGTAQNVDGAGFLVALNGQFENFTGSAFADSVTGNAADNLMYGGTGPDTLDGGDGADIIFGGQTGIADLDTSADIIFGGQGADYIDGAKGADIIFGGQSGAIDLDTSADIIFGGQDADQIDGGKGADIIFGGQSGIADLDTSADIIYGGQGADYIEGGKGADIIFGGQSGAIDLDTSGDIIFGGQDADQIDGAKGADIIFGGTAGGVADTDTSADIIYGGQGADYIEGGKGADIIFGGQSGAVDLDTSADIIFGGQGIDLIEGAKGNDIIFGGTSGGGVDLDTSSDIIFGGDGDDLLAGGGGDDSLTGGSGSDSYQFSGDNLGSDEVTEDASADSDKLDFSSFGGPIAIDLALTTPQIVSPGNLTLTLSSDAGVESVVGSRYADAVSGNVRDNRLDGAAPFDDRFSTPAGWNGVTQYVLLDFDTYTESGEHVYSSTERDAIEAQMAADYSAFHVQLTQSAADLPAGPYATLYFNQTPIVNGQPQPGGLADELDFRNVNLGGTAAIDVNDLLGGFNQPAADSDNFVSLSGNVAAHELGHLLGLMHLDSAGPIGYGIPKAVDPGPGFMPAYPGPTDAFETYRHLMASPASVGESLFDAIGDQYFGEREAIKLAFNESGTAVPEQAATHDSRATAQALAPASLAVPNTLVGGLNWGLDFAVAAISVTGSIGLTAGGTSEDDYYSFTGRAGDLINMQVYSTSLDRINNPIDSVLRVYDSSGALVPYYDGLAESDDGHEGQDSLLFDLRLPVDGTYYIQVDTFTSAEVPDDDTGDYELFWNRFASGNATDQGDVLDGRDGDDALSGGFGGDTLNGGAGVNDLAGGDGADTVVDSADVNFTLADSSLTGAGTNTLSSVEHAILTGGPGDNAFQINGWSGTAVLDGASGADTLIGANTPNLWNVTATGAGDVNGLIAFSGFENLTGGSEADAFVFASGATIAGAVDGGAGTDTLDRSAGSADSTWNISGPNSGNVSGMSFLAMENLTGGEGADEFVFANAAGVAGAIQAGGGINIANYAAYTTAVCVNLTTGTATGAGSLCGIQHVFGGSAGDSLSGDAGDNVLVGNGGNDSLFGVDGRDIVIGGLGRDVVDGGAGDDILIGGRTTHDNLKVNLLALMSEWSRSDLSYSGRINHLTCDSGGLNGSYLLNCDTVCDDNRAADQLWGRAGMDWFFHFSKDDLKDKVAGETVTRL